MERKILSNEQKDKKLIALNAVCIIITLLLSILLMFQLTIRSTIKDKKIGKYVSDINFSEVTVRNDEEVLPLSEYIKKYYVYKDDVDEKSIQNVLKKSTASEFIQNKYKELSQYILGGTYNLPQIKGEEISKELDKNEKLIKNELDIDFLGDNHKTFENQIKSPLESFNSSLETSHTIEFLKIFVSLAMIIFDLILYFLTIIIWGFAYTRISGHPSPAIKMLGVSIVSASAIYLICCGIAYKNPVTLSNSIYKAVDLSSFLRSQSLHCMFLGFIPLIFGVLLSLSGLLKATKVEVIEKHEEAQEKAELTAMNNNIAEIKPNIEETKEDMPKIENIEPELDKMSPEDVNLLLEKKQKSVESEIIYKKDTTEKSNMNQSLQPEDKKFETTETVDDDLDSAAPAGIELISKSPEKTDEKSTQEKIEMPEIQVDAAVPLNGRKCPKCGKINLSRNLFCSECGELLK